ARRDAAQSPGLVPGGAARGLMDLRALVPEWIRTLTPYPPGKPIEELERELGIRDSIKLASNENPLGPSPKAVAAITAALGGLPANPNNPPGTIVRRAAWRAFLGRLPEHLLVVADDAYAEYVEDPEYPDTIRERGDGRVAVLSLRTFSKLYGLAGLRVGYGVASGPVIDALDRIRQPFNVNALALAGALAALDDEAPVPRTLATNRAAMAFLVEAFRTLGLAHVPSAANFILLRVGDGARVYEALLRRGVIVRPMAVYGFPEHVRVRSEEHTSELQSRVDLVCRLLLE